MFSNLSFKGLLMKRLLIFCGLPYSGKTTYAKDIEKATGFKRLTVDDVVICMGYKLEIEISENDWNLIYKNVEQILNKYLYEGLNIIFDATNLYKGYREKIRLLAKNYEYAVSVIYIKTPLETINKRHKYHTGRHKVQDADLEELIKNAEIPDKAEDTIVVENSKDLHELIKSLRHNNV